MKHCDNQHRIAIIDMECMFPGAPDFDTYWKNMIAAKDAIVEVPSSRWSNADYYDPYMLAPGKINSYCGGFIDLLDDFSGEVFGLKQRIVDVMNPEQKIALRLTKKLMDRYPITEKTKKKTGFYVGAGFPDFMINRIKNFSLDNINAYSGFGMVDVSVVSRVCYHFGFEGPAMMIKTACSSSLVAIHQAVRALQTHDSDLMIAGGINLLLSPDISICITKGGFLSPDGRCKTFDKSANGYVRSEGCGFVLLKRYIDACRDGDTILGVIEGTAMSQDGTSDSISAPNRKSQIACYEDALERAQINAHQVQYVESHGTGTQLGDAIEIQSIQTVYDQGRDADNPLYVGAVKSMIGHCESAAGVAGVIKALGVLRYQQVPPNLHFHEPNAQISFEHSRVCLPTDVVNLKKPCEFAAVSSFGIAGTNAHIILGK